MEHVQRQPQISVHFSHKVITAGQDVKKAWVEVNSGAGTGPKRIEGDYVIGCDGAGSSVRKSLYGEDFPGYTWQKQLVATNVRSKSAERSSKSEHY